MLVIENKVIDYKYFMDEIEEYEIQLLSDMIPWSYKQSMEETRLLMYSITAPYMKHKKKITDFMPLYTDKEYKEQQKLEGGDLNATRAMIQKAFNIQK